MANKFSRHPGYRRLSGQDASFLSFETEGRPMNIGALAFFEPGPWHTETGDFRGAELLHMLARRARKIPGLAQHLSEMPLTGWPVWVSGQPFDASRHIVLHEPVESDESVRRIAEAELARPLDRKAPLWRIAVIPRRQEDEDFAVLFVTHHAFVDGIAGLDLVSLLFDGKRRSWQPGSPGTAPSRRFLALAEAAHWFGLPARLGVRTLANLRDFPRFQRSARRTFAFARTCFRLLSPGPARQYLGDVTGQRSVAWMQFDERPLRRTGRRLGGTPNDLVLAAVAGAIAGSAGSQAKWGADLRAALPVSLRSRHERYNLGNRLGLLLTPLSLRESDPGRRVARIRQHTSRQKARGDAEGYEVLNEVTGWTGMGSQRLLHWISASLRAFGILVTNVPGPSRSYSLGGAVAREIYPLVPLFGGQTLSVAVVRYAGSYHIGITSSWDDRARLEAFVANLAQAFDDLGRAVLPVEDSAEVAGEPVTHPAL